MRGFLQSKAGVGAMLGFVLVMTFAVYRVHQRRQARLAEHPAVAVSATPTAHGGTGEPSMPSAGSAPAGPVARSAGSSPTPGGKASVVSGAALGPKPAEPSVAAGLAELAENVAYLDQYYAPDERTRYDRDRQGNPVTRRRNAGTPSAAGHVTISEEPVPVAVVRASLRLQGHPRIAPAGGPPTVPAAGSMSDLPVPASSGPAVSASAAPAADPPPVADDRVSVHRPAPKRFNPFGSVLRCELVFTLDSTNEQTPLIGIVMEPVYNNGQLVIPAGAELHGTARPDRLRDRIFSGNDWVLVFPREPGRPNGRQLNVKGVALDRVEPDANGMTWGITDGSYGLQGRIIRSLRDEEIRRFVMTFLGAAAETLQERQNTGHGRQDTVSNTPQNAVLQGFAANLERASEEISAEIERHGVFIRVPAGHQFYFYPMQIIDPDAADVSSDIATVK